MLVQCQCYGLIAAAAPADSHFVKYFSCRIGGRLRDIQAVYPVSTAIRGTVWFKQQRLRINAAGQSRARCRNQVESRLSLQQMHGNLCSNLQRHGYGSRVPHDSRENAV